MSHRIYLIVGREAELTWSHLQVEYYRKAVELDRYLAIAYFQAGVSNFLLANFEEAMVNFNDALVYLRGNRFIDYQQLGLQFRLYSCEVRFNRGLCSIYRNQREAGMHDFWSAAKEKMSVDHDVIFEAIQEGGEACFPICFMMTTSGS